MSKKIVIIGFAIIVISLLGYFWYQSRLIKSGEADKVAVENVIYSFGKALKNVSLLSPTAKEDIYQNYKNYVTPELISAWQNDPSKALGRLTSSPWPDSIEIADIRQFGSGAYDVSGKIINLTSTGMAGSQQVEIGVIKFDDKWLISGVTVNSGQQNESFKEYKNSEGISFEYPEKLSAQYISTQTWPPVVKIEAGEYSCTPTPQEVSSMINIVAERIINNRIYCVETQHEGAAGSTYSTYTYTTPKNGELLSINFILRYPNCGNYPESEAATCTTERQNFDLDSMIDRIAISVNQEVKNDTLANQIADCIIKSDMQSKETCDNLLKKITDFESCVMAGFSIMKSNPLQCTTPDNRILIENKQ